MIESNRFSRLFLCISLGLAALPALAQNMPPATVRVAEARVTSLAPTIEVPATVASRFDARLAAEVAGQLVEVADIGEFVEKDQPLAVIDDTQLRLQEAENRGQVARAVSRIAFLERETRRLQTLAAENVAAKSLLDQTESDLEVAREDSKIAEARLAQVRDQLARTRIKAPFSGVVSERYKVLGERVSVGEEVARLVNQAVIEVVARAPLASLSHVFPDDELTLYNARTRGEGVVRTLVQVGDPRTHMFEIRVDVAPENWRIGETARLIVPTQARQSLLAVPQDALVLRRDGITVFRINAENTAERIVVEPGITSDGWVAVQGDLSEGDKVVIRGAERLRAGQTVSVSTDSTAQSAAVSYGSG